jgi:hypothetical protein
MYIRVVCYVVRPEIANMFTQMTSSLENKQMTLRMQMASLHNIRENGDC